MFSLGYCMWEALAGQRPWTGLQPSAVVDSVAGAGARLPLPAGWSARVRTLIARCWSQDPAARPSPQEVMAVLDEELRTALASNGMM